jgi:hypothetical protein
MAIGEFQPIDLLGMQGGLGNLPTAANVQALANQQAAAAAGIEGLQARAMAERAQAEAAQQEQIDAQRFQTDLATFGDGSPKSIVTMMQRNPKYAKLLSDAHALEKADIQEADTLSMNSIYARAANGDFAGAANEARRRLEAERAAGNDTTDEQAMVDQLESGDPVMQQRVMRVIGADLAGRVGLEKFASVYGGVTTTDGNVVNRGTGDVVYEGEKKPVEPRYVTVGGNIVEIGGGAGGVPAAGSRAARNNNPGNIRVSDWTKKQPGFTGEDGGFATFETPAAGAAAMTALLGNYMAGGKNTIGAIISKWAPASDGNNVNAYVSAVSKMTGIPAGKPLTPADLPAVQQAMAQVEGGGPRGASGGGGAKVVYSAPASDASVIARGQVIETPNGPMIVDKATGEARPVTMNGKPVNAQTEQKRAAGAKRVLALLDTAEKLIPESTGSGIGAGVDWLGRGVGFATDGSKAIAKLQALSGALIADMPRMEGPQSDKDVALYKQAAGDLANPTIPNASRLEALATLREIQQRYSGAPSKPAAKGGISAKAKGYLAQAMGAK